MADDAVFWLKQANALDWITPPTLAGHCSFSSPVTIRWFEDGILNACYNCVDRHLPESADSPAFIWEADEPGYAQTISYLTLHHAVCRTANILKKLGIQKGDRVVIYMPMIPQVVYAMLACARIGAVHSVVFGGFSAAALADRIADCGAKLVITADEGKRGGKIIPLKQNVDAALHTLPDAIDVLVIRHTHAAIAWDNKRDHDYHTHYDTVSDDCPPEPMRAIDPLFILYTSGSTGKPKGIVHSCGGYLVYAHFSFKHVFEATQNDIFWCSADVGWITGHSYVVYGPLTSGVTSVLFEGVPHYPAYDRFWKIIDTHQVTHFYTAPTAIRALMKQGDDYLNTTHRHSLKVLGSVGEPINPKAWEWFYHQAGRASCSVVDTWWQTETGGILISASASDRSIKAGYATTPLPHIHPALVDESGTVLQGEATGYLCLTESWPGQAMTIYGNHTRFEQTYFSTYEGKYFSGDGALRDTQGDYRITGRVDDVLNVSGHRLGTAEIEAALNTHPAVAESAVVGYPHDIKGEGIVAYLILRDHTGQEHLFAELNQLVRKQIGAIASLDKVYYVEDLPKTRSGKIMRRILRKIAEGCENEQAFGDLSTLADTGIVRRLLQQIYNKT